MTAPPVSLWDRIYAARDYLEAHPNTVAVVSGGKGKDEPMSEAICMYVELTNLGIDGNRIWTEDRAESTWENIRYSLDLIEARTGARPTRLGVLSSEYHLFRPACLPKKTAWNLWVFPQKPPVFLRKSTTSCGRWPVCGTIFC